MTRNPKKITIIIPVYNREKYISRCLRSLLNQTLDKNFFEIIVINDGSTDKTKFVLDLYKDDITILNNKKNLGLPKSLNKGIKYSRSTYIVRVDSDDYVNENFLKILYLFLEENRDMDAVSCDYIKVDDQENVLSREDSFQKPIACGIMFRSKDLESIGLYDEKFILHEEKDLRRRFLEKYKIFQAKLPLYRYRIHDQNITNNKKVFKSELKKLQNKRLKKI